MHLRRVLWAAFMVVALFVSAAASLDRAPSNGGDALAPAPDEGCIEASLAPGATRGPAEACRTGSGGGGAGATFSLLPLIAIVVVGVLTIGLAGAFLIFRSQSPRGLPEPIEGWWTCPTCGASNLSAAARCHKCGAWQPAPAARPGGRVIP